MSFGQNVTATKIELFKYKRSSQVATMVQGILDDKRKVLLKNIEEMIAEAQKTRGGIWEPLQDIYKSVNESYLSLGVATVDSVAQSTPGVMEVESDVKRVVDVTIPVLSVTEKDTKSIPYGFADTNASIDRGAKLIKDLLPKICKAAEYENSIFSLAKALEKTQKLLNALENVILPLLYSGKSSKDRTKLALTALENVGLKDRTHHRPNQLSGGQQQRVSIARAIAGTPKLILADEPTGALDSSTSLEIMKILNDLNKTGITIVLVTHEDDIAKYGSRIIKMKDGQIIEDKKNVSN